MAASSLRSCFSFSVKSSTGFLARFSVASITFFCCLRNSSSLSLRSLSLAWTSEGSSVPARFFDSASRSADSRRISPSSRRRTSTILSWVASSSAAGLARSRACSRASAWRMAWTISPRASLLATRLMISRSGSSVVPIDSITAVVAFCTAACRPRTLRPACRLRLRSRAW